MISNRIGMSGDCPGCVGAFLFVYSDQYMEEFNPKVLFQFGHNEFNLVIFDIMTKLNLTMTKMNGI